MLGNFYEVQRYIGNSNYNILMRSFVFTISLLSIVSCTLKSSTSSNGKVYENISTDISELSALINIEEYTPLKVRWINYQEQGEIKLEAVLTFSKEIIDKMEGDYRRQSLLRISKLKKSDFEFSWLDQSLLDKLSIADEHQAFFFHYPEFFKKDRLQYGGYVILGETTLLLYLRSKEITPPKIK